MVEQLGWRREPFDEPDRLVERGLLVAARLLRLRGAVVLAKTI
jgi:hypothetical protein